LYTPAETCGILPGIAREDILRLAAAENITVREGSFYLKALEKAGEAFLTNSLIEVMPLVQIGDKSIGQERPGPVTRLLYEAYREAVGF